MSRKQLSLQGGCGCVCICVYVWHAYTFFCADVFTHTYNKILSIYKRI